MIFDSGGSFPSGLALVTNNTGRPERVEIIEADDEFDD